VREAIDFLRYYAARARAEFAAPQRLPGPTGEYNEIGLHGRGVFACISPWNFPLSIFTGQIAAALAAGNAVIAKPAEQTPLVAAAATQHLLAAGIPGDVPQMLAGAMAELAIGDPALIRTDVGPVIDEPARQALERHAARMAQAGRLLYQCKLPAGTEHGTFFAPRAFEIDTAGRLEREVFGPILHVIRWRADRLDAVCDEIAATGYALTLGIHSRIDDTLRHILRPPGIR